MANKSTRQLAEGIFFARTIIIIIVYYFRTMTGIPVIGTDLIIKEYSVDYRDVITKITQQAFVIPLAMMLQRVYDMKKQKDNQIIIIIIQWNKTITFKGVIYQ